MSKNKSRVARSKAVPAKSNGNAEARPGRGVEVPIPGQDGGLAVQAPGVDGVEHLAPQPTNNAETASEKPSKAKKTRPPQTEERGPVGRAGRPADQDLEAKRAVAPEPKASGKAVAAAKASRGTVTRPGKAKTPASRLAPPVDEGAASAEADETVGPRQIANTYDYKDARGDLFFQAVRYEPKGFTQRRPDPDRPGGWIYNIHGIPRVLYRLPELRAADGDQTFVVEGEKDVDRLRAEGLDATCNPMGAGRWREEYSTQLEGHDVVIIPDNDVVGRDHAEQVARSVFSHADSVRILGLPGSPEHGDVSDYLDGGGSIEELVKLADQARIWEPDRPVSKSPVAGTRAPAPAKSNGRALHHDKDEVIESMTPKDLVDLAEELGLRLAVDGPNAEGWRRCHAIDRTDKNPSASFNVETGYYRDHGPGEATLSMFDLAMELDPDQYPDFCSTVDKLGDRYLGSREAGAAVAKALDLDDVRARVGRIVDSKDLSLLYGDNALLADLAGLERADPTAFAGLKVGLIGLKNFKARDFDRALRANRSGPDLAEEGPKKRTEAERVIRLGTSGILLFHAPGQKPYARVEIDGHREVHPVRGERFKQLLKVRFYEETGYTPSPETFRSALDVLEIMATQGPMHEVSVRTADGDDADDPAFFLDLADADWRAVRVSGDGWDVVENPPVHFRRPAGMLSLPTPARGGSLDELWNFVNLVDRDARILYVAWLLASLRPRGPFTVLILHGEQGSAKTTTSELTRTLIDPHQISLRNLTREERDLMIGANNSGILAFDNISYLSPEMSDALCRISSGTGFATRTLYTDDDETMLVACRPVMLNGIEEFATRSDLLQRSVILNLPTIQDTRRRTHDALWREFRLAQPRLLGALLDTMAMALSQLPKVEVTGLPRMADFCLWGEAIGLACGSPAGTFLAAFRRNQDSAAELSIESSPAAYALIELLEAKPTWSGTMQRLLAELEARVESSGRKKGWPASSRGLSSIIRRFAPGFRSMGITIDFERDSSSNRTRVVSIQKLPTN